MIKIFATLAVVMVASEGRCNRDIPSVRQARHGDIVKVVTGRGVKTGQYRTHTGSHVMLTNGKKHRLSNIIRICR